MSDGLRISDLTVAYGGNVVVSKLSLAAATGEITGLIGPNGAGKTTIFNVCSGLVRPRSGSVRLLGRDVTRTSPARRAQLGLGRSFQRIELCTAMTVRENVEIGLEARQAGLNPLRHFGMARGSRASVATRVSDAIERCGLSASADHVVATLPTGRRRLVELARVLASDFSMLLLDEPSSGLDDAETAVFADILTSTVADLGTGILLVEHDMSLVMKVCQQIHVIDFGTLIFSGTPAQVQKSEAVRAAYLGAESVEAVS